mmetsp:Transcript_54822/g.111894  ORF Transcript_54822/g.111894 Transcript_54822/m.111894 type:complete len:231 (+) Transcript_54822:43-735(+)|eukprot:CAMPEP_0181288760 /NCGR_PEP_ID=MMETSP1101-20121128/513_1 /TAXON_ID=46948 /ORGANISM="Rhodomonas abbreviata, Strain Caron Lab Isolate" /LENGTH=230 /DNA_ID=CAMNT_0023392921 /DNA_START=29 /DNA_END=721 /DNA_ORIENTATION=-
MRRASHLFGRALRETGQAVDRLGLTFANNDMFKETFSRHRSIMNLFDQRPVIAAGVFVAPNASVVGDVLLLNDVSIWYGAVLRADKSSIKIGTRTNVQDRAVIGTVANLQSGSGFPARVEVGDEVTIGHGALLTSCTVGNRSLIGQGAVVQEGAEVGHNCIVAAGAVVLPGTLIADNQLWAGNPAVFVRDVSEAELAYFPKAAEAYEAIAKTHSDEFLPYGTAYQEAEKL